MKRLCSTIKNIAFFGITAAILAMPVSCGVPSGEDLMPFGNEQQLSLNEDGHPVGWTDETHGKDATSNYAVVFPQDKVNRLDVTIAPADWQAMQDDMTDMLGEFGAAGDGLALLPGGPGDGGLAGQIPPEMVPPEAFEACEGMQEGGACAVSREGEVISGTCTMLSDGRLACIPDELGGLPPGDGGEPNIADLNEFMSRNPIYVPCMVEFEGQTWWRVGIRFKGQSSLIYTWAAGIGKLPLRFDFDEFEDEHPEIDDQRFFGFKRLTLFNGINDPSLMHEKVAQDIFREAGVAAPRTAFYRVHVDFGEGATYFGLYTMTEIPDDPMLETQFVDDGGNLYKPAGPAADWTTFDPESFPKKTNKSEGDWSDVEAAIAALHADRSDPAEWRAGLEAAMNVDEFLRWLAASTVIQNWDSYGNMAQNYYLYSDPGDNWRLYWISWDCSESLSTGSDNMLPREALSLELDEVGDDWPLIRFLMDDSVYRATYVSHVQEVIEGAFAVEPAQERFRAAHDLIAPYVIGPNGEQPGYTLLRDPQEFDAGLDRLLEHVIQRNEAAIEFLEADQ